ncbi:hypothetical protein PRIPAC_90201, partial [Pristionchus pacificus]|uniref:Arrestin_C domain-containing protein n=1 Tax=Pristionchus pacificus TaxID=54126 RepID=A0A2A6CTI6_PRIPA
MSSQTSQPPYRCFIETEKQAYLPGDRVNCNAELTFDRKFTCDEIVAMFTGEARVYWMDKQVSAKALCRHQPYYQKRTLFEQKKTIWRAEFIDIRKKTESTMTDIVRFSSPHSIRPGNLLSGEKKPEWCGFEEGKYVLPMDFSLPEDGIYSSVEVDDELVSVRYQIELHCLANGRIMKKFRQLLHVFAPRDLSGEMDKLATPKSSETTHQSKIGKLSAILSLPKTGYIPGEPLNAKVVVHNMTSNSVKFASVCIVKKIVAIADTPTYEFKDRDDETAGSILPFHKIERAERKEWIAQIYVPALTPNLCIEDFIHINYEAKLSVGFDRAKKKNSVIQIKLPITIGTVAIDSTLPDALPSKVASEKFDLIIVHRMAMLNLSTGSQLPSAPPSYEDVLNNSQGFSSFDDAPLLYSAHEK